MVEREKEREREREREREQPALCTFTKEGAGAYGQMLKIGPQTAGGGRWGAQKKNKLELAFQLEIPTRLNICACWFRIIQRASAKFTASLLHTGPADAEDELAGPWSWSWTPATAFLLNQFPPLLFLVEIFGIQLLEAVPIINSILYIFAVCSLSSTISFFLFQRLRFCL